jgi:hypothetical protein
MAGDGIGPAKAQNRLTSALRCRFEAEATFLSTLGVVRNAADRPNDWRITHPWRAALVGGLVVALLRYFLDAISDEMVVGDGLFAAAKVAIFFTLALRLMMYGAQRSAERKARRG